LDFWLFLWLLVVTVLVVYHAVWSVMEHNRHQERFIRIDERLKKVEERLRYRH